MAESFYMAKNQSEETQYVQKIVQQRTGTNIGTKYTNLKKNQTE